MIFFAEDRSDWLHIGPLADSLEHLGFPVIRLTADREDSVVVDRDGMFIGSILVATQLFLRLPPCVVVMTMTDLDTYHLKRSVNDVHYVYVFHSLLSTHRAYRPNAFDAYDSILCSTPYHLAELSRAATVRDIRPQTLYQTGYCRMDTLMAETKRLPGLDHRLPRVLLVPTWGPSSLIEFNLEELIQSLVNNSIEVVLRFHPMSIRHESDLSTRFLKRFEKHSLFSLDGPFESIDAFLTSDIVLTDWSGAAHEFSLGLLRPAIFIDTPKKENNEYSSFLGLDCYEDLIRQDLGAQVSLDQIHTLPNIVSSLIDDSDAAVERLRSLRDASIFNPGDAVTVAASQIGEIVA